MKKIELSAYTITWIEVRAKKGNVIKKDAVKLFGRYTNDYGKSCSYKHFPNKTLAQAWLNCTKSIKLEKIYDCRLFSDKQFGMCEERFGYAVPFTHKQYKEVTTIGN
jgi:hypothetical protein